MPNYYRPEEEEEDDDPGLGPYGLPPLTRIGPPPSGIPNAPPPPPVPAMQGITQTRQGVTAGATPRRPPAAFQQGFDPFSLTGRPSGSGFSVRGGAGGPLPASRQPAPASSAVYNPPPMTEPPTSTNAPVAGSAAAARRPPPRRRIPRPVATPTPPAKSGTNYADPAIWETGGEGVNYADPSIWDRDQPAASPASNVNYADPGVFDRPAEPDPGPNNADPATLQGGAATAHDPYATTRPREVGGPTRERVVTEGGKQRQRPWWQRAAIGAGLGALAGANRGLPGMIGGAVTGGAMSGASRQLAANIGTNVVDIPSQQAAEQRAARTTALEQAKTKGALDIQTAQQNIDWNKGREARHQEERGDVEFDQEQQRQEFEERKRHTATEEHLAKFHAGLDRARAEMTAAGLSKDDIERRTREASAHAQATFPPGDQIRLQNGYTDAAYREMQGPQIEQQITDVQNKLNDKSNIMQYDALRTQLNDLSRERDKRRADASTMGRQVFDREMDRWAYMYHKVLDANGGQTPDLHQQHGGRKWSPEDIALFARKYNMTPQDAALMIGHLNGQILQPGENPNPPAAAQTAPRTNYGNAF